MVDLYGNVRGSSDSVLKGAISVSNRSAKNGCCQKMAGAAERIHALWGEGTIPLPAFLFPFSCETFQISLLQDKYPEYKWLSAWKEPRNEEPEEKGILRADIKRGMSLPRYLPRVDVGRKQEIIQGEGPSELKNEYEHVGVDPGDVSLSRQSDRPHSDTEADLEDTISSIQDGIVREEMIQQDRETSEQDEELQLENTNLKEPRQGDEERLEEERAAILPLEEQLESRPEKQETKSKEEEGKIYSDRVQEKAVKKCPDCCCCVIM